MVGSFRILVCIVLAVGLTACAEDLGSGGVASDASSYLNSPNGESPLPVTDPVPAPPAATPAKPTDCTRLSTGVQCTLNPFGTATIADLSDANGWSPSAYSSTLRYADVNGDGALDVCGRSPAGMVCYFWQTTGFSAASLTTYFPDSTGWNGVQYYSTIGLADVNGDGRADLCGRTTTGIRCFPSNGVGFTTPAINGPAFADSTGYGVPAFYLTIRYQDYNLDGKSDICATDLDGQKYCWISSGTGFTKTGPL